jgi:putative transposase
VCRRFESCRGHNCDVSGLPGRAEPNGCGSVGKCGRRVGNALAETTVGLFKTEWINRRGPWRNLDHVEIATLEWVDWYNHRRPHEAIDDFTPVAVEDLHNAHRTALAEVGDSTT